MKSWDLTGFCAFAASSAPAGGVSWNDRSVTPFRLTGCAAENEALKGLTRGPCRSSGPGKVAHGTTVTQGGHRLVSGRMAGLENETTTAERATRPAGAP